MTFENYRPGRWRGDSSRNWESLHRFQFAEWHGGGRRTTAWISVMCLKPLHPEKPSPGFRYRVWCNVLSETTSLVWSDMTTRFILLSFGFLMNKTNDRAGVQLWARAHACSHLTGEFSRLGFCEWGPCLWTLRRLYRWCQQLLMVINSVFLLKCNIILISQLI